MPLEWVIVTAGGVAALWLKKRLIDGFRPVELTKGWCEPPAAAVGNDHAETATHDATQYEGTT